MLMGHGGTAGRGKGVVNRFQPKCPIVYSIVTLKTTETDSATTELDYDHV